MADISNGSILASTPAAISDVNESSQTNSTAILPFDASCYHSWPSDPGVMLSLRVYFGASLVLIVIGLVGNALSIIVFSSREMRAVSSNVYLLSLAVSDSMYLLSILLNRLLTNARCWFFPSLEIDVVNRSRISCVGLQYLTDLFSDYSTCLILAFTVERGLAVFRPIAYKERCTVARARCVCLTMFGVIAACIAPYHVIMIGLNPDYHVCTIIIDHEHLFAAFYLAEQVALRVLPVVAIALLNTLIVVRVTVMTREKNRRRRQMSLQQSRYAQNGNGTAGGRSAPVGGSGDDVYEMVPDNPTTGRGVNGSVGASGVAHQLHRHRKQKRRASLDERNLQLTIVLILVSSTYILSYLPVLVSFVLQKLKRSKLIGASWDQLTTLTNYANPLHIAGFAINFFLYTVSGRVFRDQLKSIVCGRRRCGRAKPSGYAHPGAPGGTSSTNAGEPSAI